MVTITGGRADQGSWRGAAPTARVLLPAGLERATVGGKAPQHAAMESLRGRLMVLPLTFKTQQSMRSFMRIDLQKQIMISRKAGRHSTMRRVTSTSTMCPLVLRSGNHRQRRANITKKQPCHQSRSRNLLRPANVRNTRACKRNQKLVLKQKLVLNKRRKQRGPFEKMIRFLLIGKRLRMSKAESTTTMFQQAIHNGSRHQEMHLQRIRKQLWLILQPRRMRGTKLLHLCDP
mmetsp:Transcript_84634/g.168082  ORF Transcript_84634/g.168082 Transcript_84634/m.168082 type:complete len:232 (-) Transcript_84634:40-735(-)